MRGMRIVRAPVLVALFGASLTGAGMARFSVDNVAVSLPHVVVTQEPRAGAPGYLWVRAYFYAAPLSSADASRAARGGIRALSVQWGAVLQLTVDARSRVTQIDLALPGHTCTIAETEQEIRDAVQAFRLDAHEIHLAARGRHVCDMRSLGMADQTFAWDVAFDSEVIAASPRSARAGSDRSRDARPVDRRMTIQVAAPLRG